nr:BgaP412 [uncultured bacterium]
MNFPHFLYGGDYNPDQWPSFDWQEDARIRQEAGVFNVSLGIFSWVKMEPKPGFADFAWLDIETDLLHAHGVSVNLATPTASPPNLMIRQHPEILPVTLDGVTLWHGGFRHYCPHNPDYRKYAVRIAQQLAERYKDHPALKMWHVDNEYSCHADGCYCLENRTGFRNLQEQYEHYGTLDHLNAAWGTAFWSQAYGDWEEIYPPRKSPAQVNPTQQLDWARFTSDSWLVCFDEQKAALKAITPNIPVTSFMGFHKGDLYFKFARHETEVAQDTYPDTFDPEWMIQAGMICDLIRSVGERRPWVLMEQASSQVNWREGAAKRPGVMFTGSYQAVARGAGADMFFQWRASKAGAEKHHSYSVPHGGTDTRVWREVKGLGNELPKLSSLLQSQVKAYFHILMDWNNWWALELDSKPSSDLKMHPQLYAYYKPFFEHNITVDFAHPESDLSKNELVIAPNLYLVNDAAVYINQYVENGGNLDKSFFSGIVDENEHIRLADYPAPFREMLGLSVEEYAPYSDRQTNTIRTADGNQFHCTFWADVIHLKSAKALATFEQDYYSGGAAITHNQFGKPAYIDTQDGSVALLSYACVTAGVQSRNLPGIELLQRSNGTSTWLFVLNHSTEGLDNLAKEQKGKDLLTGTEVIGSLKLEPKGVAILQVDRG